MGSSDIQKQLFDLVARIECRLTNTDSVYQGLLVYFFRKGWKTFRGVLTLGENGLGEDADIDRTLWAASMYISFLLSVINRSFSLGLGMELDEPPEQTQRT